MKILLAIVEAITSPFSLILRSDNFVNHNKPLKILWIILISLIIVTGIVLLVYKDIIFK